MIKSPDYFVMVYAIITGAHFFPYAWFYKTIWYALFAGIIVAGALVFGLILETGSMYYLPGLMSPALLVLSALLYFDFRKKQLSFVTPVSGLN